MAKKTETKVEKTVNCAACNKHLKKVKRYYRNGKYFCTKSCWKAFNKKAAAASSEQA